MMGMTITVEVVGARDSKIFDDVFSYFRHVDEVFSTYKETSEITKINKGLIKENAYSEEMRHIFSQAKKTTIETHGYFSIITNDGVCDPSGIVKGWAIKNAADMIEKAGYRSFFVDAGGDIEARGTNEEGAPWTVGIRDPFNPEKNIVKVLYLKNNGVATSGSYSRGAHIYNPHDRTNALDEIISITVIGPNVYDADRFATAAFAMQRDGIAFIELLPGFEGYMIDTNGTATMTSGFDRYTTAQ